jgi:hypothetical protein
MEWEPTNRLALLKMTQPEKERGRKRIVRKPVNKKRWKTGIRKLTSKPLFPLTGCLGQKRVCKPEIIYL